MSLSDIILTKEDFAQSEWQNVIADSQERECNIYSTKFFAKATESEELGDSKARKIFRLLGDITSLMLRADSPDKPFAPLAVFPDSRTAIIDDFSDAHLDILKELVPDISDAEMRARVADILWVRKRDSQMAQIAVTAYLESAQYLEDPEKWSSGFFRIKRASHLAILLGKNAKLFNSVIAHIESVLDKYNGEDSLFFSANLMELLQKYRQGDPVKYTALAEKAAIRAESEHGWHRARNYWQITAQWHILQNDLDSQRAALLLAAETYVKESEDALKRTPPSYQAAYTHIEKAIEALRRIGGTKERVEQLHKVLIEYQQNAYAEMKPVTFNSDVNLSQLIDKAREEVKGKSLIDSLLTLAALGASSKVDRLRTQVQESTSQFLFSNLVPEARVNKMGKTIARKSSMISSILSNDAQKVEEVTRIEMFKLARLYQQVHAQGVVEPARYQINLENNVRLDDWFTIVSDNPLVPPNREYTYARGLDSGLKGDFLVAAHLLIPQLENSVRYLLNQRGVVTSTFDDKGIQNEKDLNTLLYSDEVKEIFSEDILFDLQGLLIHRFGSNLRNRMAHGLIDDDEFYSLDLSYLWWFTLHLCCLPILAQMQRNRNEQPDASEDFGGGL
jgi:hypothetical protein